MELRPYQNEMLRDIHEALKEHRSVAAVLPTGGGKTVIFSKMGQGVVQRGKRAWFVAHRDVLCEQMSEKLLDFGVPHGFVMSGQSIDSSLAKVCMVQTLRNKLAKMPPPDVLIIDEGHHMPASAYADIYAAMPMETSIVLFTATPERLDGKGLDKFCGAMVQGPQTADLISLGFLVRPVVYAPQLVDTSSLHTEMGDFVRKEAAALLDRPTITGDAIENYIKYANGTAAVAFCVSIDHAVHVANQFNEAGIRACHLSGKMNKDERKRILSAFRDGIIQVLTTADLISEGFDLPRIETAILLRPTKSLSLFLQQVGRALRIADGKLKATIIDHVGNVMRHGMPDARREWALEGALKRKQLEDPEEIVVHTCRRCFLCYTGSKCPDCPAEQRLDGGESREIECVDGELVEIKEVRSYLLRSEVEELLLLTTKAEVEAFANRLKVPFETCRNVLIQRAKSLDELRGVARILGYRPNWAKHRFSARGGRMCSVCDSQMVAIKDFNYQCTICHSIEPASELLRLIR